MNKILIFSLSAFVLACSDDLQEELTGPQNMMSFSSVSQLKAITEEISSMSEVDLDRWEKENNFVSFRSNFNLAVEEYSQIVSDEARNSFLEKHKDILTLEDSVLVPRIQVNLYQAITNRAGEYRTMNFINKVIGDYVVSAKVSDYYKLEALDQSNLLPRIKNLTANGVRVNRISGEDLDGSSRTKIACSTHMVASYFDNHSGCRDDNEVIITARSYILISTSGEGDWRQPWASVEVNGTERNWLCNWYSYKTQLEYRNVSFNLMAWTSQNGVGVPTLFSRTLSNRTTTIDAVKLRWESPIGDPLLNQLISAQPFSYFYGEASSRGVGNNWAVLRCP